MSEAYFSWKHLDCVNGCKYLLGRFARKVHLDSLLGSFIRFTENVYPFTWNDSRRIQTFELLRDSQ